MRSTTIAVLGASAAIAWCLIMAHPTMAVDTLWNFDGNLASVYGTSTMSYRADTASITSFGTTTSLNLPAMYDDDGSAGVMSFPSTDPSQGYTVSHGVGGVAGQYTMIWDILYPTSSDIKYRSLYQTNQDNSNDGELFVHNTPCGGIGISGQYHGSIQPDKWNRVAITRDASGTMHKFINGGYVGEQDISSSRWELGSSVYHILADENNETEPGYLSSYRFLDRAMSQEEIFQLGGVNALGADTPGEFAGEDPSHFTPGSFTIAVLGDTQSYVRNDTYAAHFADMTQWLVDNKTARNIQFVTHVGDIVDSDDTEQWDRAMAAMSKLDGEIPYAAAPGNHDYGGSRTVSQYDNANRFGPSTPYDSQSTLAGYYPTEPNSRMNTYHTFEANGQQFLVLALEFGPRDNVVDWAKSVADAHPDHRAILLTHAYMFDGGMWFDASPVPGDPEGRTHDQIRDELVNHVESVYNPHSYSWVASDTNDGKELWDKLVKDRDNFSLVLTGHQFDELDGYPYLLTQGDEGNDVYQMLFDTQTRAAGGKGWIRLLEFLPDGKTVKVKTYSSYLDQWSYATDENYTIELSAMEKMPGDANRDGRVDNEDAAILASHWQMPDGAAWGDGDFDGDGKVTDADATILAVNWNSCVAAEAPVPEPSVVVLIGGMVVAVLGFRRRQDDLCQA